MSKKVWIAGLVALVLVVAVTGAAYAAPQLQGDNPPSGPNPPGPRGGEGRGSGWQAPRITGEITSLGDGQFTMTGREEDSDDLTVLIDEETAYIGSLAGFSSLKVGDEVAIAGGRGEEEGTLNARVIALASDLPFGEPMGGEVTSVNSSKLVIETRNGSSFSFNIISTTDYLSRENTVTGIDDVVAGDHVVVVFEQTTAGTLVANLVLVGGQGEEPPADSE